MKLFHIAFALLITALLIAPALADEDKDIKVQAGIKNIYGEWTFENSEVWHKNIYGRVDMDTDFGLIGPWVNVSFADDHIGVGGHYLIGQYEGDYYLKNRREPDELETSESGSIRSRREDMLCTLRITPFFKYVSLMFGYRWMKHHNFEKRGHGVWNEYLGDFDVPVGTHHYEVTDTQNNRIHGFQYGIALRTPSISRFYAWGNGYLLPNMNIKYTSRREVRFDTPGVQDDVTQTSLSGRVKQFKTELGIAYDCESAPIELKLSWWLERSKADEPDAKNAPIFDERMSGAVFSVGYTF